VGGPFFGLLFLFFFYFFFSLSFSIDSLDMSKTTLIPRRSSQRDPKVNLMESTIIPRPSRLEIPRQAHLALEEEKCD